MDEQRHQTYAINVEFDAAPPKEMLSATKPEPGRFVNAADWQAPLHLTATWAATKGEISDVMKTFLST